MQIETRNFPSFSIFRLLALSLILVTTIFLRQEILGIDVVIKVYSVACLSFLVSLITVLFWKETQKIRFFPQYQMCYDILLTSYLIFYTGINESVFLFLYLLNIILGAITYLLPGSLIVAFLAGAIYGLIYYINKDTSNDNQFYTLFYNELFFLLTALLSGLLMDELKRQSKLVLFGQQEMARLRILTDRLMNNIPAGILQIAKDNSVLSINQTCLNILDLNELPGGQTKFQEIIPELDGIIEKWNLIEEEEKIKYTFKIKTKKSHEKTLSLQIVNLLIDSKNNTSVKKTTQAIANEESQKSKQEEIIFVLQDVSRMLELEEKITLDSKLAAIGQLAAGIAHEIRTPLASISGSIETLLRNIKPNNLDDEKLMSISLREIRRLDKLITEFLIFVKPTSENFSKVNLKKVIDEVVLGIQNIQNLNIKIKFKIDIKPDFSILGDSEKIKQVFFNLFYNAIEAATSNVEITISAKISDSKILLIVKDDGPGIAENIREKIFNPFFTTKRNGTGLGLPNVAQIVKKHKGDIRALANQPGACFEIVFPTYSYSINHKQDVRT